MIFYITSSKKERRWLVLSIMQFLIAVCSEDSPALTINTKPCKKNFIGKKNGLFIGRLFFIYDFFFVFASCVRFCIDILLCILYTCRKSIALTYVYKKEYSMLLRSNTSLVFALLLVFFNPLQCILRCTFS